MHVWVLHSQTQTWNPTKPLCCLAALATHSHKPLTLRIGDNSAYEDELTEELAHATKASRLPHRRIPDGVRQTNEVEELEIPHSESTISSDEEDNSSDKSTPTPDIQDNEEQQEDEDAPDK